SDATLQFWRAFAIGMGAILILTMLETLANWSASTRTTVAVLVLLACATAMLQVLLPLLRSWNVLAGSSLLDVARRIGAAFPPIRDRLLNALQVGSRPADADWVSPDLAAEAIRVIHRDIAVHDLTTSVDRSPIRRWRTLSALVVAAGSLLFVAAPGTVGGSLQRLLLFTREFTPPPRYLLTVTPGTIEAVKGTRIDLRVDVRDPSGTPVDRSLDVELFHRVTGQEPFDRMLLRRDSSGTYATTLSDLRLTTEYYAMAGGVASDRYQITVLDRPVLHALRVRVEPPAYARLSIRVQEEFLGDIRALPGTKITITGEASKPLSEGVLRFGDSSAVPLRVRDRAFVGTFTVRSPGTYRAEIVDTAGLSNASPVQYPITLLPDGLPLVRIVDPGRNIDVAGNEPMGLFIETADDYGVSSLRLGYRLSHSKFEEVRETYMYRSIPLPPGDRTAIQTVERWDLEPLRLVPEDVVEYYVEVFDNDDVNGPKSSRSPLYTLRLPSLEEVFTDIERGHDQTLEDLGSALEDAKKLREDLEKISQDLKQNKEADWEKQQQAKEVARKVEEIRRKVDETGRRMDAMTSQMQQQQVLSTETLEKYLELQNLFQLMNTEELQQALRQMQQSMQSINREQLQKALEQVQFSEERFRQNIERTINLLKRIQVEQKMDEVTKRAADLAQRQEDAIRQADSLGRTDEDQARRQEELAADHQRLQQESSDLQRKMEEFFTEMPAEKMAELNKELSDQRLDEAMRQAAQQMRSGDMRAARQQQAAARQALQEFAEQMSALQQQMLQNQAGQVMNSLRRATTDLLEISRDQEALRNEARNAPANSPQLRQNAQGQLRALQDLSNVIANLGELAQRSFAVTPGMGKALGEALANMQNAMRNLEGRNGAMASQDQTGSMASLNGAAQQVQQALQAMMQGSDGMPGGMGLMQQLQMMAAQQQSLNMQTQRMGGMEVMQRAAEAARISREQEAVRKSLEQLDREARAGGGTERALGDLRQIAEEMREVVRNLEQNNASPETIRRQERILSRLLDASRSMQERDFERRRRATTGQQIVRRGPAEAEMNQIRLRLREDLLRALEQGYARDYQELIRRYFEELEKSEAVRP
ncbi:MAG: DUF4175 family protein, partial [Bacteroidota bacterium]